MKVAVIGGGNWGEKLLYRFHSLDALGAIVEVDDRRRETLGREYPDASIHITVEELSPARTPGVAIATPVPTHFELATKLLNRGFDVFVEKPMAMSSIEAESLLKIADDNARILMVGHLLLYHPAIRWIRSFMQEGGIGSLYSVHCERLNFGRIHTVENVLWSLGVHDISLILFLLNSFPNKVSLNGHSIIQEKIEDDVYVHLEFPFHQQAHLHVSWLWPERRRFTTLVGEKGMLVYDEIQGSVYLHNQYFEPSLNPVDGGAKLIFSSHEEPLRLEIEDFLGCMRDRKRPLSDGKVGRDVVRIVELALQSQVERKLKTLIHESAYLDSGCTIGTGTRVWHFSHVESGATIGENCSLGQNVYVGKNVHIGKRCKIQNNVSLYEGVTLEDDVFCGPSVVFTNVRTPRSAFPRNTAKDFHPTLIAKGATLGANSTIVCGNRVGAFAFVAAGAVVTRDVPDHALVAEVPAKIIGWVCECGLSLDFSESKAHCNSCGRQYKNGNEGVSRNEQDHALN